MSDDTFTVGAVISQLFGAETAEQVTIGAEYTWHRDADFDPFAQHLNGGARAMGLV